MTNVADRGRALMSFVMVERLSWQMLGFELCLIKTCMYMYILVSCFYSNLQDMSMINAAINWAVRLYFKGIQSRSRTLPRLPYTNLKKSCTEKKKTGY